MNRNYLLLLFFLTAIIQLSAQEKGAHRNIMVVERERPVEWGNLVFGGRFMDCFLPMTDLGGMTSKTWGAPNVIPRDINNGIEDADWSYWGGNIRLEKDGKYHMAVCRWSEAAEKGHFEYHDSMVVHAVSTNPAGPFKVVGEIGLGHNPEWYVTDNGNYIVYVTTGGFMANSINGPWEAFQIKYNVRDRNGEMNAVNSLHNNTFAKRENGSFIMINRKGDTWFSKDGISEYYRVTSKNGYPPVLGKYEDPVIWRDNIQYHMIVNDWQGRIAWYLRSKDGLKWKVEPGEAYMPGVSVQQNGRVEDWHKYERIKILQDSYGRAIQANFAVIDVDKYADLGNDNFSSKNITIPLIKGKLIGVLNKKPIDESTKTIEVKILAEADFNPHTDLDINSLRFGASDEVNFGKGSKVIQSKKIGNDIILTFNGEGNGLSSFDFAAKLLGKTTNGKLLFGFSRLPGVSYIEPMLSSLAPTIISENKLSVEVQNFGQIASNEAILSVVLNKNDQQKIIASGKVKALNSFEKTTIELSTEINMEDLKKSDFDMYINKGKKDEVVLLGAELFLPKK